MSESGLIRLTIRDEEVVLHPDRTLFLPGRSALLVADTHFGKAATFRRASIPVPMGSTAADLARLSAVITAAGAERLFILGDFFHAKPGRTERLEEQLFEWRQLYSSLEVTLIRGNHDRHAGDPPSAWDISVVDEERLGTFILRHEPSAEIVPEWYELAGHIHPAVRLRGPARDVLRLPCFYFGTHAGLLPSFGSFTGGHPVRPTRGERVYAIADDQLIRVPTD